MLEGDMYLTVLELSDDREAAMKLRRDNIENLDGLENEEMKATCRGICSFADAMGRWLERKRRREEQNLMGWLLFLENEES
jgi:hypothetical protein